MKSYTLDNGLKIIYKYREGTITSFCLGFNGGALEEIDFPLGTAHAVEHMVFKGTKSKNELEINNAMDELFGFQNAMTNYPYVIYYGTSLSSDFKEGLDLFGDIIMNPSFPEDGFLEEMSVIKEELKEWSEDPYQYCEDTLLFNSFKSRRIKNLIIGNEESLNSITLNTIKDFYNLYYNPENAVISVVSSLSFQDSLYIIKNTFGSWHKPSHKIVKESYERNIPKVFTNSSLNSTASKIKYCFPIHDLNEKELKALILFNYIFGEGVSSVLYDEIRTKHGLSYEVSSSIKFERGIKLFTITLGTSPKNVDKAIDLINSKIDYLKTNPNWLAQDKISKASKSIELKRELFLERSIQLCKELTTYELMFGDFNKLFDETKNLNSITPKEITDLITKVLVNPSIQII